MMKPIIVKRHFIDGDYGQIHYRTAGEVSALPAVVCLHMVPKSSRLYHRVLPFLAQDRLAIAIDYPGYGESTSPLDESEATIENYAKAVLQVLDDLDLKQVDLVGYHTGCMVSVAAANTRPELVRKVINISAPILTEKEVSEFLQYYSPVELDEAGTRLKTMWERILFYRGPGMTLEMCAESLAENLRAGEAYEWGHAAAFDYAQQYIKDIKVLKQPLFVMNLDDDLYEHSKRVDNLLNNGKRKDYMQWGAGFLDAYTQAASIEILNFLNEKNDDITFT